MVLLVGLFIWILIGHKQKEWGRIRHYTLWWCWIVVLGYQALVSLWSVTPGFALNFLEGRMWISLFMILLADALSFSGARIWMRRCIGVSFILGILYGFYQIWVALPILRSSVDAMAQMDSEVYRERFMLRLNSNEMFGSRLYANLFGTFAGVGLFACLPHPSKKFRYWEVGLALLMFSALLYSQSKGALLVSLVVMGLWTFKFLKSRYNISYLWLFLPILLGTIALVVLKDQLEASVRIRWDYWKVALTMLKHHPFGIGALNFSEYYGCYMHSEATEVKMAHNDHLQFFCEFGVIGGLLHVGLCVVMLCFAYRSNPSKPEEGDAANKLTYFGMSAFMIYMLITCLGMGMGMGAWDLPLHGAPFLALSIALVIWIMVKSQVFDFKNWSLWGCLLLILHAGIDMPFYDHSLIGLILCGIICETEPSAKKNLMRKSGFLLGAFMLVTVAIVALQRYQHLLISDWMGMQTDWETESLMEQNRHYKFDHQSIEPIYRSWFQRGKPVLGTDENTYLQQLLKARPLHSGYALHYAMELESKDEAETYYRRAYEHHPMQPKYAFHLGEYLFRKGQREDAIVFLRLALERHLTAQELSYKNSDFLLHLLRPEQIQKAKDLIQR